MIIRIIPRLPLSLGRGNFLLKSTFRKVISLSKGLHVSEIKHNLVSVHLLTEVWVKLLFDSDRIVLTRSKVYVGTSYCSNGLLILNVEKFNKIAHSCTYIVKPLERWHTR